MPRPETFDEKLALMEDMPWMVGIPLEPSTPFDTGDMLQMIFSYPLLVEAPETLRNRRRRRTDDLFILRTRTGGTSDELRLRTDAAAVTRQRGEAGETIRRRRTDPTDSPRRRPDTQE